MLVRALVAPDPGRSHDWLTSPTVSNRDAATPLATRSETDGNRYIVATTFMVALAAIDRVTTA